MYSASSSLRACTLRLPSVVCISFLRSLKLSESLTASALTMPSRSRSWIRRSSTSARADAGAPGSAFPRTVLNSPTGRRSSRAAPCLATVPPRDRNSKSDVQTAERDGHQPIVPGLRGKKRQRSNEHEANPHDRNEPHRERAAGHNCRPVQEQPHAGNGLDDTSAIKHHRQQRTDE